MQAPGRQCEHTKPDGTRCRAGALPGSALCYFHDPTREEQRRQGRRAGGKAATRKAAVLPADSPDLPLADARDAASALGVIANRVLRGELDPKPATTAIYAIATLLRAQETGEADEKLAQLEARLKARQS